MISPDESYIQPSVCTVEMILSFHV